MNYKLVNEEIKSDYGSNLFICRGVENIKKFMEAPDEWLQSPDKLDNMQAGADLLLDTIGNNRRILLVVDSDCDGYTSATIIYNYIKRLNEKIEIDYLIHEGKQHGLEDHIDSIMDGTPYGLVILPDSSSNDVKYHEMLKDVHIPCLVLDHHIIDVDISDNAVVINNQSSPNYTNKELTGAGVVYQFCRYLDKIENHNWADDYLDLTALGIIGDMGSVLEPENRWIIKHGLHYPCKNELFKALLEKQNYSITGDYPDIVPEHLNDKLNPITIAFYIAPLINAMVRFGSIDEKKRMFEAFCNGSKMILSGKRGAKGTFERADIECVRECVNARARQNKKKEEITDNLEIRIAKYDLLKDKILVIHLEDEDDFPPELNGLVAMQLSQKFKRPTIVARVNSEGFLRGSARGLSNCAIADFKEFLNNLGMFEYTAGHPNAFGISINDESVPKFLEAANMQLKDIDFGENIYEVNFVRQAVDKDIVDIINDLNNYRHLWGQKNDEPLIYISDINIKFSDIRIMGKNSDTVKFEKFGVTYIKFFAKDLIEQLKSYPEVKMEIIGKAKLNEFNGTFTPQVFIEEYEMKNGELEF